MSVRKSAAVALAMFSAAAWSTFAAAPANAAPVCAGAGRPTVTVADLPGTALEGLTLDPSGRAFVTDPLSGPVVRIDAPGRFCVLGLGPQPTSEVQSGRGGQDFSAGRLFGVTFNGVVYEIPGGFDPDARTAAP